MIPYLKMVNFLPFHSGDDDKGQGHQGVGHQPWQQQVSFLLNWAIQEQHVGHQEHDGTEEDDDEGEAEFNQWREIVKKCEGNTHTIS